MTSTVCRVSGAGALVVVLLTSGCTTVSGGKGGASGSKAASAPTSSQTATGSSPSSDSTADSPSDSPSASDPTSDDAGSSGDSQSGLVNASVGQEAKTSKMSVKVSKVVDPVPIDSSALFKPAAGKKWVDLNVTVKNLASKPLDFSSMFCMQAKTDANTQAQSSIMAQYGTQLSSKPLQKGDTSSGDVVYEIASNQKLKSVDFKCDLDFDGDQRTIRVDLAK